MYKVPSYPKNFSAPTATYPKPHAAIPVEEDPNKGTGTTNFCKPDILSVCTAGEKWQDHKRCKYAYKNSRLEHCRHFVMKGHCDCMEAQKASTKSKTLTDCMGL